MRAALLLTALVVAAAGRFDDKITELAEAYPYDGVRALEEALLKQLQDEKERRRGHAYNQKAFYEKIAASPVGWTLYAAVKNQDIEAFLKASREYRQSLSAEQLAQEEDAAEDAAEMAELTRVGIENGGP